MVKETSEQHNPNVAIPIRHQQPGTAGGPQAPMIGSIPLPPNPTRPKVKLEPTRTTKTNQKLVVFPEAAEGETLMEPAIVEGELQAQRTQHQSLRRVTAYLTAEGYDLRRLQEHLGQKKAQWGINIRRYDEVLYTPYSFADATAELSSDDERTTLETAVASQKPIGEVFYFDYGVVVIWGLGREEEERIMTELHPFERDPLAADEEELEEFQFLHDPARPPRLFNDVISLKSGHPMIKLTISHALAQSVKLSYFEELAENAIVHTQDAPKDLALRGSIKLSRTSINRQIGELLTMRMNINLISNILDTPELFWSEPSLGPLYRAVRAYLEISQRVDVLNQRCAVISDLLDILRDHANQVHGERLEWTIIILIAFEIVIGISSMAFGLKH